MVKKIVLVSVFIAAVFVILLFFVARYFGTSSLIIENQTGNDIRMLVVLWPDGATTRFRGKLCQNEKITMKHAVAEGAGLVEIFFQNFQSSQWCYFQGGGYVCPNISGEDSIIIDKTNVLVESDTPHPFPEGEGTEIQPSP